MCKCACKADLKFFSELRGAGIPLDEGVARELNATGLSIYQVTAGRIFALDCSGTGYVIGIGIRNDSPRVASPHAFRLEIPWEEERFAWLEPSCLRSPSRKVYTWPGEHSGGFPAGEVLNHRLGAKGRIFPGDCLEGFLLGTGDEPIPQSYRDCQWVEAKLTVFTGRGDRYETNLKLRISQTEPVAMYAKGADAKVAT